MAASERRAAGGGPAALAVAERHDRGVAALPVGLTRGRIGVADLDAVLALSDGAGWNQTADDWALFCARGSVVGCRDGSGRVVATAAALPYEAALSGAAAPDHRPAGAMAPGWISMVLVTPLWQHRGVAGALLDDVIALLEQQRRTPWLDATPAGAPVYRRRGFGSGFGFERWQAARPRPDGATQPAGAPAPRLARVDADLDAIAALDAAASAIGRRFLLADFVARRATRAWLAADGSGCSVARAGRRALQIGPLVAADYGAAVALLDAALAQADGAVHIDVPTQQTTFAAALQQRGFTRQRPFVRMALGALPPEQADGRLYAVAGPEFG